MVVRLVNKHRHRAFDMRSALAPVVVLATLGASAVHPRALGAQQPATAGPTPSEHTVKRGDT